MNEFSFFEFKLLYFLMIIIISHSVVSISKKNTNVALVLSYLYKAVEVFCEYFKGTVTY